MSPGESSFNRICFLVAFLLGLAVVLAALDDASPCRRAATGIEFREPAGKPRGNIARAHKPRANRGNPMPDLDQFRRDTRAWLAQHCPPEMRQPIAVDDDVFWGGRNARFASEAQRVWFERMRDKGWTVPDWPKQYGGGGLDGAEAKV